MYLHSQNAILFSEVVLITHRKMASLAFKIYLIFKVEIKRATKLADRGQLVAMFCLCSFNFEFCIAS